MGDCSQVRRARYEFELKLVGPATDVLRVPAMASPGGPAAVPAEWTRVSTSYFDTDELRFANAGISLRIQEEAGVRTLTGKIVQAGSGVFVRREVEREIVGDERDLRTGDPDIDAEISRAENDIGAVARTTTDRWSLIVSERGAVIEISAEIGRAERMADPPGATPIAEVELELLKGSPEALFELARRLIETSEGRLRLSNEAKLDLALRGGKTPDLSKFERLAVPPDAAAADLLSLALRALALRVVGAAGLVCIHFDAAAVKQLRVALRRIRALERIFRRHIDNKPLAPIASRAKAFSRQAGAVRDLDVFIGSIAGMPGAEALAATAQASRAKAMFELVSGLASVEFNLFAVDLLEAALAEPWRVAARKRLASPAQAFASAELDRQWSKLLAAGEKLQSEAPSALHEFRLRLKKFRYAAQFFRDFFDPPARKPFFDEMSSLQDILGAFNDAVVAQEFANRLSIGAGAQAAKAAGFVAGCRSVEAAFYSSSAKERWRSLAALAPFWRTADTGGD